MHSLVVVDMQWPFSAARFPRVRQMVLWEVERTRQKGWPVVLLEADGNGQTLKPIRQALTGYPLFLQVVKYEDDGSLEVDAVLCKMTRSKKVRVVGVNTDQCVFATVLGLCNLGYQVTVNALGCNSNSHNWGLYLLSKIEGLTIVNRHPVHYPPGESHGKSERQAARIPR